MELYRLYKGCIGKVYFIASVGPFLQTGTGDTLRRNLFLDIIRRYLFATVTGDTLRRNLEQVNIWNIHFRRCPNQLTLVFGARVHMTFVKCARSLPA